MVHSRLLRLFGLFFLFSSSVSAQQDPEFTQFMFNKMYYNPAYAGIEGITQFNLLVRSKWTGYASTFDGAGGAPTTQVFTADAPLYKLNSGFGAYLVNDNLGNLNNLSFQGSYAYHFAIKEGKLSIGVNLGFFSQSIDFSKYRPSDPNDPLLLLVGKDTQVRFDMGAGAYYQAKKFYVSASVSHLASPSFNFGIENLRNALQPTLFVMGGYYYEVSYNLLITPSLLVQSDFTKTLVNVGAIAKLNDKFWGGLTYKHQESVSLILGMSLLKSKAFDVGYAFDYIVSDQEAKQPTSHEIRLGYSLPISNFGGKKVIRTPRFRH
jgi:type IX secretion system PorP/SprF family membrane protein